MRGFLLTIAVCGALGAQERPDLTIEEAEEIALRNHPRIAAAQAAEKSIREGVAQANAAMKPLLAFNTSGSLSEHGTLLGAGQLPPQGLYSRLGTGLAVSQTVFDGGRSRLLASAAQARAGAQSERANAVRLEIRLRAREAYYRALQAQRQLAAVRGNLELRRITLQQVSALARSNLRSTLDVSFAELNMAEAEVLLNRAENDVRASEVELDAALGLTSGRRYTLRDPAGEPAAPGAADEMVTKALAQRPELAALRMQIQASRKQAQSEGRQLWPGVSLVGAGGYFPAHDKKIHPSYAAVGANITIPILTGGLFDSRRREAEFRAEAETQELRDLEVRIAREVRLAWVAVDNARRRLELTAKVVAQAERTLKLAQTRYDLGLASIVELGQAQLSRTAGEVDAAAARYEYLRALNTLDYQVGKAR